MKSQTLWKPVIMLSGTLVIAGFALSQDKTTPGEYARSQVCTSCHAKQHDLWKSSKHAVKPSASDPNWATDCGGCHSPRMSAGEDGIGCESCHGPGRGHASGGDKTKIVSTKSADNCGQCHIGNDLQSGGKVMSDGSRSIKGFVPGMTLASLKGLVMTPIDPDKTPPETGPNHRRVYNMWLASGHSKSLERIIKNDKAQPDCYSCHSDEGFKAKLLGKKVDLARKQSFSPVTCVTCHESHSGQLVMDPEKLCSSCHGQRAVLEGKGAKGVEDTRSFHSGVACVSCHMSEKNHLMKVIRPDDPDVPEKRIDTCTGCHKDNNRKARAEQIVDWQSWYKKAMDPLDADLAVVNDALKGNPDALSPELKSRLNDLRSNLAILKADRSIGAHNLDFSLEIMAMAAADLKEIKAAIK